MDDPLRQTCQPNVVAMDEADQVAHLARSPGWQLADDGIEKTFSFAGWLETVAFVDAVAWLCHVEDHHPDLRVGHGRCGVRFSTHSAGGISMNDFICAAKADALVAFVG